MVGNPVKKNVDSAITAMDAFNYALKIFHPVQILGSHTYKLFHSYPSHVSSYMYVLLFIPTVDSKITH